MKLRFLGTSAAAGFPNPHCACENCMAARAAGGKSIRMMSSAMIDDDLIIDLGPDISGACLRLGVDLTQVRWVLQTHPHEDHLLPLHATARSAVWAAKNVPQLEWFMSTPGLAVLLGGTGKGLPRLNMTVNQPDAESLLKITTISPWQEFTCGPYRVQTVPANHDITVSPMLFAIEREGRRLFYGSDTTTLPEETWPRLAELGWTFDVVVFDHNDGFARDVSATHMGSGGLLQEVSRMREHGLVSAGTRVYGTHLGHHSCSIHEVENERANALGYEIAWDGLVVEV